MNSLCHIDGSVLEGGGQIIRNAVALACLLGKPIRISKIRHNRSRPGLQQQHLTGVQLLASQFQVQSIKGDYVQSCELEIIPKSKHLSKLKDAKMVADTQTAGATTLLAQILLPCLVLGSTESSPLLADLKGGTNVPHSPPVDEMCYGFIPLLNHLLQQDSNLEMKILRRGFYPKGGGEIQLSVKKHLKQIPSFLLVEKGKIQKIEIRLFASIARWKSPQSKLEQLGDTIKDLLTKTWVSLHPQEAAPEMNVVKMEIVGIKNLHLVNACVIMQTDQGCVFCASQLMGQVDIDQMKRNKKRKTEQPVESESAEISEEELQLLVDKLATYLDNRNTACVDEHIQDQLIIFMALANGTSKIRTNYPLELHTETAIHICETMTNCKFTVTVEEENKEMPSSFRTCIIECNGIGFVNE